MKKSVKACLFSLLSLVTATSIVVPVTSCASKENSSILGEQQLTKLWTTVNDYIIKNKVTVATNAADANWNKHSKNITDLINNFELGNNQTISKHFGSVSIKRNLANISFKLNSNTSSIKTMNLHDGYIEVEENGAINLNQLALSSPEKYFTYENNDKKIINSLSADGQQEPNILIPYGAVKIVNNSGFYRNKIIKNIILSDTVIMLPDYFLFEASSLVYAKLSRNLQDISRSCFARTLITKIDWYEGIGVVHAYAFDSVPFWSDVVLPKSIKIIEESSFQSYEPLGIQSKIKTFTTSAIYLGSKILAGRYEIEQINIVADELSFVDKWSFNTPSHNAEIHVKNEQVRNQIIKYYISNHPTPAIKESQIIIDPNL